jgi:hypothetical protein
MNKKSPHFIVARHCEGDSPKQSRFNYEYSGLLRFTRNDGKEKNIIQNHKNQINQSSDK